MRNSKRFQRSVWVIAAVTMLIASMATAGEKLERPRQPRPPVAKRLIVWIHDLIAMPRP